MPQLGCHYPCHSNSLFICILFLFVFKIFKKRGRTTIAVLTVRKYYLYQQYAYAMYIFLKIKVLKNN